MDDFFRIDGMSVQMKPAITKWSFEDLEDDPDLHRWRAWWVTDGNSLVSGIELRAYPVIKKNYASVWINTDAYRERTRDGKQWEPFDPKWMKKRLLHNNSGSAWAKPTQEEAIHSLAVRLTRWANHLARDVEKARSAANALEKLRPNHAWAAKHTKETLNKGSKNA
jgi:hypothetical protein